MIAEKNNINNFYDEKVVEAYWIGNELLDKVTVGDLKRIILYNFVQPELLTKEKAEMIINGIPDNVVAHHSFHVFFVGSITGRVKLTPELKDQCKVSWGEVLNVFENQVEVETEKLFPQREKIKIKADLDEFLPKLTKGDLVSFHWGRICEKLTSQEYNNLVEYTMRNYKELIKLNG